jgi:hypothetical protein
MAAPLNWGQATLIELERLTNDEENEIIETMHQFGAIYPDDSRRTILTSWLIYAIFMNRLYVFMEQHPDMGSAYNALFFQHIPMNDHFAFHFMANLDLVDLYRPWSYNRTAFYTWSKLAKLEVPWRI